MSNIMCVTDFNFQTNAETIEWLCHLRTFFRRLPMGRKLSRRVFTKGIIHRLSINNVSITLKLISFELLKAKLLNY